MQSRNFELLDQMGEILIYSNGEQKEYIHYSVNKYYSKWVWDRTEIIEGINNEENIISIENIEIARYSLDCEIVE